MKRERILTEVGTNEWQVVVFLLGDQAFAINVDKTREILRWTGVRSVPRCNQAMLGIATVRGEVIPLIDLRAYLDIKPETPLEESKVIVAEYHEAPKQISPAPAGVDAEKPATEKQPAAKE